MKEQHTTPPKWMLSFFKWFCKREIYNEILGDCLELYERRKRSYGKPKADALFLLNVFSFFQPYYIRRNKNTSPINQFDMFQNYLTIAFRVMSRNKMFIAINVIGMSVAIACVIITWHTYDFNERFDSTHKNAATIYRVNSLHEFQNEVTETAYVPLPLSSLIKQNISEVKNVVRYTPAEAVIRIDKELFNPRISYVDPAFTHLFTFDLIEGNADAIADKRKLLISEHQSKALFGNEPAIGKSVTQILPGNILVEYTVGGVFRQQPANSSFNDDIYASYENFLDFNPDFENGMKWEQPVTLFVQIDDASRVTSIQAQFKPFAGMNNKTREDFIIRDFVLDPFLGMAVRDVDVAREGRWTREAVNFATISSSAAIAILMLLVACFNLTNTAISVYSTRLKEIGLRKVLGGLRSQLIFQFIGETMFICILSLIVGMLMMELFLMPAFNDLWPYMKLETNYFDHPEFMISMSVMIIVVGLIAGSYPAFYISKFQPVSILKNDKLTIGGTNILNRILLTLQFAFTTVTVVFGLAFAGNARFQNDFDLGFNHEGVVYTRVENGNEYEVLRNALTGNPKIGSIAGSKDHITSSAYTTPIKHEGKELEVDALDVGDNYLLTAGFTLISGRDFRRKSETDYNESVIITEKLAAKMGWDKPIGKEIIWKDSVKLYVIGVAKDTYASGLWGETKPLMIRYTPEENYRHLIVSSSPKDILEVNQFIKDKWNEVFPNRLYQPRFMDENMVIAVQTNTNLIKTFGFLGVVSLILSVTGLYTLVSLNIIKKKKEIGVRKVFGASVMNITKMINKEFVIILVIASVIGSYLGAMMSTFLMSSIFKYNQPIGAESVVMIVILLLTISGLTIGFKVRAAARMSPVVTLRNE
jgi:putative ABC transport system permease protein